MAIWQFLACVRCSAFRMSSYTFIYRIAKNFRLEIFFSERSVTIIIASYWLYISSMLQHLQAPPIIAIISSAV